MNGTYWVEYDASDWLHHNYIVGTKHKVLEVLHESKKFVHFDVMLCPISFVSAYFKEIMIQGVKKTTLFQKIEIGFYYCY